MKHLESALQADVIQLLNVYDCLAFHPANEGKMTIQARMRLAALGVRAGVPDLVILCPDGVTRYIELKTPTGKLSEPQLRFGTRCAAWGIPWAVCRSLDDVKKIMEIWKISLDKPKRLG